VRFSHEVTHEMTHEVSYEKNHETTHEKIHEMTDEVTEVEVRFSPRVKEGVAHTRRGRSPENFVSSRKEAHPRPILRLVPHHCRHL
jgi:hypothetical protein